MSMQDPPRLLDSSQSPVEQALLRAAESDAPSAAAKAKAAAALGLEAAPAAAAATAATTASSSTWFVAGAATVLVAGGAWVATALRPTPPVAPPPPAPVVAVVEAPAYPPAPLEDVGPPLPVVEAPPPAPVAKPAPPPKKRIVRAQKPNLTEELQILDGCREALDGGDVKGAMRALRHYRRRYPKGTLAPEADVLRVRALIAAEMTAEAGRALKRVERLHPGHPALPELRRRLADRETE